MNEPFFKKRSCAISTRDAAHLLQQAARSRKMEAKNFLSPLREIFYAFHEEPFFKKRNNWHTTAYGGNIWVKSF
jgi:hypothetical protein